MVAALDRWFGVDPPAVVIVQGDTTSALAGALAANHADLPLVHVEAGLRSFDRSMPEEHNRVLIDHLADLCCAPTALNRADLLAEAIPENRIMLTGNTIVEAVHAILPDQPHEQTCLPATGSSHADTSWPPCIGPRTSTALRFSTCCLLNLPRRASQSCSLCIPARPDASKNSASLIARRLCG